MRLKIIVILNWIILLTTGTLVVYSLFFAEETDSKLLSKCVIVFVSYLLAMLGVKKRKSPFDYKVYEVHYKDILEGAFSDDKQSYRKLLKVTVYYNRNQLKKAYKVLEELRKKCMRTKDYTAVYTFWALCLEEERKYEQAIAAYEKVVQHDMANSRAWSNMGMLYMEMGKSNEAFQAYSNAVLYDSKNEVAYNNMAAYFIRIGEVELALENAFKALELNSKMYQAMSTIAIAYKVLGDDMNAEKYCKMYGVNGGNAKELRAILDSM